MLFVISFVVAGNGLMCMLARNYADGLTLPSMYIEKDKALMLHVVASVFFLDDS